MNAAGVLILLGGIWVISQVTVGNALGRLGIAGQPDVPNAGVAITPKAQQLGQAGASAARAGALSSGNLLVPPGGLGVR